MDINSDVKNVQVRFYFAIWIWVFYVILNTCARIVEKNPTKFKIDNKELTVQRSFIEQAREEVKVIN